MRPAAKRIARYPQYRAPAFPAKRGAAQRGASGAPGCRVAMNFAVPDGHVGDECLESREGSGVAERAPYPRIAEVVSGMVEFIAEASRVWNAHWRTLPRSGLVPLRSAFERSEEHTSELQSLMRISYAVFCLTKKK